MEEDRVIKTAAEWNKILPPKVYEVTRAEGTEDAFTGKYHDFKGKGIYRCLNCGNDLFSSETKYDSGTAWPSFWKPISEKSLKTGVDLSGGLTRTKVMCRTWG